MESNWKDYFSFTKKERIGIYVLLTGIGICTFIPRFFKAADLGNELKAEAIYLQEAQAEDAKTDLAKRSSTGEKQSYNEIYYEPASDQPAVELFPFDPNTLDSAGWRKLGVNNRTIRTIRNYISKGGRFRNANELQRIYGLKKEDYDRLMPYVRITAPATATAFNNSGKAPVKYIKTPPPIIDINQADTSAFISLPGIGSKLANRIINFRDKLGGFYSVQQVGETFGLPDSTFQLIKPRLQCASTPVQKININTADVNTLKQHPYIRWNIANAIIQFRQQHGVFHSPEELQQIVLITPELYQKIATYVTVE
ncbi:helix-hairpin-helix domain-containing protein [Niastella caeni]|uniref:Helix-hairpin-helix domain-containing protein n=1 Tax=Niastella caeni TaxID=2569763 RepID=A0A4S8I0F0_9BACT|nr:helix-hairpin-helix domain-containing protein [Niastella caeni]THU41345.1 helix-hairpin-helix domain-containing protein [Niastella caeni]